MVNITNKMKRNGYQAMSLQIEFGETLPQTVNLLDIFSGLITKPRNSIVFFTSLRACRRVCHSNTNSYREPRMDSSNSCGSISDANERKSLVSIIFLTLIFGDKVGIGVENL